MHSHEHPQRADVWTNIAAGGEAITGFVNDAYWLGSIFDIVSGCGEDVIGLSYYALAIGAISATLSTVGSTYCHRVLNATHQAKIVETGGDNDDTAHIQVEADDGVTPPSHENGDAVTLLGQQQVKISWLQRLAVLGDFISHVGEITGPITFVANLAFQAQGTVMPRWGKAVTQAAASVFGAFSSVANVRACKNAIEDANQLAQNPSM